MGRISAIAIAFSASLALAATAHAKVDARNPSSVAKAMTKAGFPAELGKDESGDPMISSRAEGSDFTVHFYDCEDNRNCTRVQFMLSVPATQNTSAEALNGWNAENYFGRAYRNNEGAARLEMDVDLDDGGMSDALFVDNLEWWASIVDDFVVMVRGDAGASDTETAGETKN